MSRHRCAARGLLLGMLCLIEGCAFFTLREELSEMQQVHVITGTILGRTRPDGNVLIVLLQPGGGELRVAQAAVFNAPVGEYVIEAPVGVFYLAAFEDLNNDLTWDGQEPLGYYGRPDAVTVSDKSPQTMRGFDIRLGALTPTPYPADFPKDLTVSPYKLGGSIVKIGRVIDFDDPILSPGYGVKGYWEPLTFVREVGICLFFRETYDPAKVPVLFVHGALGTPLGWRDMVGRMDAERFQPWFYYYPTGIPLDQSSRGAELDGHAVARHVPVPGTHRGGPQHGGPGGPVLHPAERSGERSGRGPAVHFDQHARGTATG